MRYFGTTKTYRQDCLTNALICVELPHMLSTLLIETVIHLNIQIITIRFSPSHIVHMNVGRRINERFDRIPFGSFVRLLTYKAAMHGIAVHTINDAYTSQTVSRCGYCARTNRRYRCWFHCQ